LPAKQEMLELCVHESKMQAMMVVTHEQGEDHGL
jgi:hypothetical protein